MCYMKIKMGILLSQEQGVHNTVIRFDVEYSSHSMCVIDVSYSMFSSIHEITKTGFDIKARYSAKCGQQDL